MGIGRRWLIIGLIVLLGLIGLIIAGYWFNWDWTGFNQHIGPQVQPAKTLWDWLQLLIIPMVLAAALSFILVTTRTEQKIAAKRYKQDQEIALDKQRNDLLQAYLDFISKLLLKERLRTSAVGDEVRNVARVRTITLLFQLDARRIGYAFSFLREAGLMSNEEDRSIISLHRADLHGINLSQINLSEANLSGAILYEADFSEATLINTDFSDTIAYSANFSGANLSGSNFSGARIYNANLSGTALTNANLSGANLFRANLNEANLNEANLTNANLSGANLSGANLDGASITEEQLKKAKSLTNAIMPDGSKYNDPKISDKI